MMDYPIEESVVLLKRARWFQDYLKVGTGRAPRRPPPPPGGGPRASGGGPPPTRTRSPGRSRPGHTATMSTLPDPHPLLRPAPQEHEKDRLQPPLPPPLPEGAAAEQLSPRHYRDWADMYEEYVDEQVGSRWGVRSPEMQGSFQALRRGHAPAPAPRSTRRQHRRATCHPSSRSPPHLLPAAGGG